MVTQGFFVPRHSDGFPVRLLTYSDLPKFPRFLSLWSLIGTFTSTCVTILLLPYRYLGELGVLSFYPMGVGIVTFSDIGTKEWPRYY